MKRVKSSYERLAETKTGRRNLAKEALVLEATEVVSQMMEESKVSKAVLARRLETSRPYITQLLSGSKNMTVRTLADLAFALGYTIHIQTTKETEL